MLRARAASPPVDTDISPDITSLWPIYRQYYRHTFRQLSLRKVKPELARGWRYARQTLRHGIRLGICCPARAIRLRPELILRLLDEKPRHGYEIIKEIEDRFGGTYSPSPGTVYPTLTLLEDLGYARAMPEEGGKKIYEITDEGRQHLKENEGTIDDIFSRIEEFAQSIFGEPMMEVNRGLKNVASAVYGSKRSGRSTEQMKKIREILDRAAKEIDSL